MPEAATHSSPETWRRIAVAVTMLLAIALAPTHVRAETPLPPAGDGDVTPGGEGDGLIPPGDWTAAQRAEMLDLIARTEAALPQFADVDRLESLGFHDFGIAAPGGYVHYINRAWINDEFILDPDHPESLLFQWEYDDITGEGTLVLKAAMFFLPDGTTMDSIPADIAWLPGWHVHPDICITDDLRFAGLANADGSCTTGHPQDGPPMTHVWITDNGCGDRFSMVDTMGLMCEMHGHDPGDDPIVEPDPDPDPNEQPSTTTPTQPETPPGARPITAQPTFTG